MVCFDVLILCIVYVLEPKPSLERSLSLTGGGEGGGLSRFAPWLQSFLSSALLPI